MTEIPEIKMNWAAIPEHHRMVLRTLPRTWELICDLSWAPVEEQIDPPEWFTTRLRELPLQERELMLFLVEGTGQDTALARGLLGL